MIAAVDGATALPTGFAITSDLRNRKVDLYTFFRNNKGQAGGQAP